MKRRHFLGLGAAGCLPLGAAALAQTSGDGTSAGTTATGRSTDEGRDGGSDAATAPDRHPRLRSEGDRTWLVGSDGTAFFATGLTITPARVRGEDSAARQREGRDGPDAADTRSGTDSSLGDGLRAVGINSVMLPSRRGRRFGGMARIIAVDLPGISASLPKDRIRFPDVFDPAVQRRLAARVAAVCRRHRDDPSVLGFAFTRDPLWDGRRARELVGTDWVSAIRAMNRSSPGKHRYLKYLQERYADAGTVATFYRTKAPSFDELLDDPFDRVPHEVGVVESNDRDFRKIIAKEFYRVVGTAVREAAPDRLFCGDRFRFREHPPEVFEALREHVDVLCVEFPEGPDYDPLYFKIVEALVGRPVLVSAVAWPAAKAGDGGQDGGGTANDTAGADRVEFYRQLASTPAIIGIHAEFTPAGEARERLNELAGLHDSPTLPPNWAALSSACETARTAAAGG